MAEDEPKEKTKIQEANEAAERIEKANKKFEELITRQEAMMVENKLSGKAEISEKKEEPKEETDAEYANRIMAGEADGKEE